MNPAITGICVERLIKYFVADTAHRIFINLIARVVHKNMARGGASYHQWLLIVRLVAIAEDRKGLVTEIPDVSRS